MAINSQNDIVDQFLQEQSLSKDEWDRVKIPGLLDHFTRVPPSVMKTKAKQDSYKMVGLTQLHTKSRTEIATTLLSVLDRPGIVGLEWQIGEASIKVESIPGFNQKKFNDAEREALYFILLNAIKARPEVKGVRWGFGQEYIELKV